LPCWLKDWRPFDTSEAMDGPCWQVVGGVGRGGIVVRHGSELSSPQLPARLSTSAVVRQLARTGDRICYELLSGTGPDRGWVSVSLGDRALLVPQGAAEPEGVPQPPSSEASATVAQDLDIQVVTLGAGVVAELRLPISTTAADLREELFRLLGVPAGEQHLVVGTQVLEGAHSLGDAIAAESSNGGNGPVQVTLVQAARVGLAALSGSRGGALQLWDLERGKGVRDFEGHRGAVTCVALRLASRHALSGSEDGSLRLWDLGRTGPVRELQAHVGGVTCLAVDWPSLRALSGGEDNILRLWDLEYGETLAELLGHALPVTSVFWDSALGCAISGSRDCSLRLWRVETGESFRELRGHLAPVNCVTANFRRQIAISGSIAIVRVWINIASSTSHEYYRDWEGHTGWVITVAHDWLREVTLTVDQEGTFRLFSSGETQVFRNPDLNTRVTCMVPLWTSKRFLGGSEDGVLHLWNEQGEVGKELQGDRSGVLCVVLDGADAPAGVPGHVEAGPRKDDPSVAVVLLSLPVNNVRRNIFQIEFPGTVHDGGSTRPTVGQLRRQLAQHHPVPYLERLRFQRPGHGQLADSDKAPVPPMELDVAGPGSVVQALMLSLQGASSGLERGPEQ